MILTPTTSDTSDSDDSQGYDCPAKPKVPLQLRLQKKECEELKEASQQATRIRWALEKELDQKNHELALALQTSQSRYDDCVRMDESLHDYHRLESELESVRSENNCLKKSLVDSYREAHLREQAFEAEKIMWTEEREYYESRISFLADSLKHGKRMPDTPSPKPEPLPAVLPNTAPEVEMPPEIRKELSELRELVPAYVETLDTMEITIENLNTELEELNQAYHEVLDKSCAQQELIEQLNQQTAEADQPQLQDSLASEIAHAAPKRPSSSSSSSQTKLLNLRRSGESTRSADVDELKQTNAKLNDYLERLLSRIIGLEAFEHVLNADFEAIRNGHSNQPAVFQAPTGRTRRTVSSSLAPRALHQLKAAKSKCLDKLNNSASAGVQVLAKPFASPRNPTNHFASLARLMPYSTRSVLLNTGPA